MMGKEFKKHLTWPPKMKYELFQPFLLEKLRMENIWILNIPILSIQWGSKDIKTRGRSYQESVVHELMQLSVHFYIGYA